MDDKTLAKLIKDVLSEELKLIKSAMVTKDDLKAFATKDDLNALKATMATKDDLKAFATKEDLKAFATKDDLKAFATKDDLNNFATKEDLKAFATKEDFLEFEARLSSTIEKIREGVRLSLIEVEQELRDIKSKLRFYDFDYISRQNDAMIKILKDLYEEKTLMTGRIKDHDARLELIESRLGN
ncbi:MAG: hypothetical protein ACUVRK_10475 [Spirochaetota bacterium]